MFHSLNRRGFIVVLSSPSGGGKSSLAKSLLLKEKENMYLSISITTRNLRPGEIDGSEYFFKTRDDFFQLLNSGQILEYTEIYDNFYGTPIKPVKEALSKGQDVLFDVDFAGAKSIKDKMPEDVVTIFILPPDLQTLELRLKSRAQDDEISIKKRLMCARDEIRQSINYDYIIINEDFDESTEKISAIIKAERQKSSRISNLKEILKTI